MTVVVQSGGLLYYLRMNKQDVADDTMKAKAEQ